MRVKQMSAFCVVGLLVLTACGKGDDSQSQKQPPPPVVDVVVAEPTTVMMTSDLTGRLDPIRQAEVRARAAGILQKRLFTEGGYVKAGQPLFQIDNAPYVANLNTAKASLASAQANLTKADADIARYRPLVSVDAISKQEFDAAIAQQKLARAQVQSAQAAIQNAQISVGYAYVKAPISGNIGKSMVTEGALVGNGDATQLALIQQTDRLYVDLYQTADQVVKIKKAIADGQMAMVDGKAAVTIHLSDGTEYAQKGLLLFTDMTVDPDSGQVSLRAEIPNPDGLLLPGQFVKASIPQAQIEHAFLIPVQAVTRGSQGSTVMVANADGSIAPKVVQIAQQQGNNWVITEGLNAGDKVIIDGLAVVQLTGAKKVQTQLWKAADNSALAEKQGNNQAASEAK